MNQNSQNADNEFSEEYQAIRTDLKKVVLINLGFFALLVALYFADREYDFISDIGKLF